MKKNQFVSYIVLFTLLLQLLIFQVQLRTIMRLLCFVGIHVFRFRKLLPMVDGQLFCRNSCFGDSITVEDELVAKYTVEEGFDWVELKT